MKEFEFNKIMEAFTDSLAEAADIEREAAEKVIKWLAQEGVIDFPVLIQSEAA